MGNMKKRVLSIVLTIAVFCSLLPVIGTAATVDYVYNGRYIYNWGSRGTEATFMSPNGLAFYEDNDVTLEDLASLSGATSAGSVPSSSLYRTLQTLMRDNHNHTTSYAETKDLYRYTDCQNGGGKISSFYSGNAIGPAWGEGSWNREHTWPNSKGLAGEDENDIMMLRPTSTSENSSRGNTAYGKSSGYYDPNEESNGRYNLHGDVARIMLYTYVRWGNTGRMWGQSGVMESREVLLKWMEEDPVDTWELGRNDAVEAITGTRNVFVDFPELAFVLFGSEIPANYPSPSGGISTSVSYNITALSENTAKGTVSVSGRTITAVPAPGYKASGYTLVSGEATVSQSGNQFIVRPSSDVTIEIRFEEKPPVPTATKLTQLPVNGDVVALYNSGKVMGTEPSGARLAGIDATLDGSALELTEEMAQLTVSLEGSYYIFTTEGKYLTSGSTGNALSFGNSLTDLARWTIASAGNGAWYITNVGAAYNGTHNQALEYYSGFTTYGIKQTEPYQMQLFKVDPLPAPKPQVEKLAAPVVKVSGQKITWEAVENADSYEIYRATSKSGKYTLIANQPFTYYEDIAVAAKTYYYKVKAVYEADETKNSDLSKYVSLTRKCDTPVVGAIDDEDSGKPVVAWFKVVGAKKYTIYRATSETGKYKKIGTTSNLSYTDTKASAGTTYFYKVVANASSSKYSSGYSNIDSITCTCARPSLTIKIDANTGKPSLSWKKVSGAANYGIYRQLADEDGFYLFQKVTGTSFVDITAPIDTKCEYMVQALGNVEELDSAPSKAVSATSGIAKPAVKGSIDAATGKPVITWQAVEGAVKYEIYRSTKSSKSYKLVATVESLSYTDETVSTGKTYYYKVKAIGQVSKSAESSYVKLTGKCSATEAFVELNETSGKPVISWYKVSGAKKYTVYRATAETGKYTKLGTTTKLSYTDSKAKTGVTYFYKVIVNASSSKNDSIYSNIVSTETGVAAPKISVKTDSKAGKPVLSWKKVEGAMEYWIYRQLPGEAEPVLIDIAEGTSYLDESLPVGGTATYMVRSAHIRDALNSGYSNAVTGTAKMGKPLPACYEGLVSDGPALIWEPVEGAVTYKVLRATKKTDTLKYYTEICADANGEDGFVDETAQKGKTYYYKVVAVSASGVTTYSSYLKVTYKK